MASKIECPSCNKQIQADSAFCRYCGHRISIQGEDKQSILDRTADFADFGGAVTAIGTFFERWPDPHSPEARDVSFTRHCLRLLENMMGVVQGKFEDHYESLTRLAGAAEQGLPTHLSNGLATSARVKNQKKEVLSSISSAGDICAAVLQSFYGAAEKEYESLLVEGQTQAQIKQLTMEDVYADAKVHYASFQKGDLAAALRGFTHLKEMNPEDAYFRNCLGSVLLNQNEIVPALQEYLFGLSRDPTNASLLANTLRCLCGLALFPAAVEIARHCEQVGANLDDSNVSPWVTLARAISAAVATNLSKCTPEDFSRTAADLIDEVELPERPWLRAPRVATGTTNVLHEARVFISYRHAGGMNHAQRLERGLKGAYPAMHVFRDETLLVPGVSFIDQIRDEIDQADVFLALVDATWARGGTRSRLHSRKDILRRELARAFEKHVTIVPVLLEGAQMPTDRELPAELEEFAQLHAQPFTEANFDRDLGLLQAAMTRIIVDKRVRQRRFEKDLDELSNLDERDPERADAMMNEMFKPAIEELRKFYPAKAAPGQGVRSSKVELEGVWECEATGTGGQVAMRFVTEGTSGTPFSGELRFDKRSMLGQRKGKPEPIKGTWMPVLDTERGVLLGIFLDGLKSGEPFNFIVPFHRQVGHDLVGTDSQGVTFSSRNVEPKREGF